MLYQTYFQLLYFLNKFRRRFAVSIGKYCTRTAYISQTTHTDSYFLLCGAKLFKRLVSSTCCEMAVVVASTSTCRSNNGYSRINQSFIVWEGRRPLDSWCGREENPRAPSGCGRTGYSNGTESAPSPVTDLQNLFSPLTGLHTGTALRRQPPALPSYFGNHTSQLICTDFLSSWKKLKIWKWNPYFFSNSDIETLYWSFRWSEIF